MTVHVFNGDQAGAAFRAGMPGLEAFVHRDDLAVGPIGDADAGEPGRRIAFWQAVCGPGPRDIAGELRETTQVLGRLAERGVPLVIWHGASASDQCMLRRVVWWRAQAGIAPPIAEVALEAADAPDRQRGGMVAAGMFGPAELARHAARAIMIGEDRARRLAGEWAALKADNAEVRAWGPSGFTARGFGDVDRVVDGFVTAEWQPAARVVARAMRVIEGLLAGDLFVFWRLREMAGCGAFATRGDTSEMRACEVAKA